MKFLNIVKEPIILLPFCAVLAFSGYYMVGVRNEARKPAVQQQSVIPSIPGLSMNGTIIMPPMPLSEIVPVMMFVQEAPSASLTGKDYQGCKIIGEAVYDLSSDLAHVRLKVAIFPDGKWEEISGVVKSRDGKISISGYERAQGFGSQDKITFRPKTATTPVEIVITKRGNISR